MGKIGCLLTPHGRFRIMMPLSLERDDEVSARNLHTERTRFDQRILRGSSNLSALQWLLDHVDSADDVCFVAEKN